MQYRKGAIELFGKYCTDYLVRECHLGEGYFLVSTSIDLWAEAVWSSDDKHEALYTAIHTLLEPISILDGAKL